MDSYAAFMAAGVEMDDEMADLESWLSDFVDATQAGALEPVVASHARALAGLDTLARESEEAFSSEETYAAIPDSAAYASHRLAAIGASEPRDYAGLSTSPLGTSTGPPLPPMREGVNSMCDALMAISPAHPSGGFGMGVAYASPHQGLVGSGRHSGLAVPQARSRGGIAHDPPTRPLPFAAEAAAKEAQATKASQLDMTSPTSLPAVGRLAPANSGRDTGGTSVCELSAAECGMCNPEQESVAASVLSSCKLPVGCYVMSRQEFWSDVWLPFTLAAVAMVSSMRSACMKHGVARRTADDSHWIFAYNWDHIEDDHVRQQPPTQQPGGSLLQVASGTVRPLRRPDAKPSLSEAYRDARQVEGAT